MKYLYFSIIVSLFSCSGNSETESTSEKLIFKKADYGTKWPLSVDEIEVYCDGASGVFFKANGRNYALNGAAKSQSGDKSGMAQIDDIWLPDPELPGFKIGLPDEWISEGLKACEE